MNFYTVWTNNVDNTAKAEAMEHLVKGEAVRIDTDCLGHTRAEMVAAQARIFFAEVGAVPSVKNEHGYTFYTLRKKTLKELRSNPLYCRSLLKKGNAKLKDTKATEEAKAVRYMQFNLPALKSCPYASKDCKRFCYAKRDERYPSCKESRARAYELSRGAEFVERMTYTLHTELDHSKRYGADVMTLLRLHESGDLYALEYLKKWIDIAAEFVDYAERFNIHIYTKSFRYFLELDAEYMYKLRKVLARGVFVVNLSIDKSTTEEQLTRAEEIRRLFPSVNTYAALEEIDPKAFTHVCDCADCGACRVCSTANGSRTAVKIH